MAFQPQTDGLALTGLAPGSVFTKRLLVETVGSFGVSNGVVSQEDPFLQTEQGRVIVSSSVEVQPPFLLVTDNQNGTGGVATISRVTNASTNFLFGATWNEVMGTQGPWINYGFVNGPGIINIVGVQGYFVWMVISVNLGTKDQVSNLDYQNLSNINIPILPQKILDEVKAILLTMNFPTLIPSNIWTKWLPRGLQQVENFPVIILAPGDKESYPGVLCNKDDIGYPVLIMIIDEQQADFKQNLRLYTGWRWDIMSKFRNQMLPTVTEVVECEVEVSNIFDKDYFENYNLMGIPIQLRFTTRTTRG